MRAPLLVCLTICLLDWMLDWMLARMLGCDYVDDDQCNALDWLERLQFQALSSERRAPGLKLHAPVRSCCSQWID